VQSRSKYHKITSMHPTILLIPAKCTLTYSLRAFQAYGECCGGHHDLGDLNVTNKTNKLPSFIEIKTSYSWNQTLGGVQFYHLGDGAFFWGWPQLSQRQKLWFWWQNMVASNATIIKSSIKFILCFTGIPSAFTPYPLF